MTKQTKTFANPAAAAAALAADFAAEVNNTLSDQAKLTIALSGGNSPKEFFACLARDYADKIDWNRIHFFWSDERCVPPDDSDSNYGMANELLLRHLPLDAGNVHRVHGESDPDEERSRYENEIYGDVELNDLAVPQFDFILLGMGEDGHTASLFPHQMQYMTSDRVCEVAIHPETAQKRITLTGPVLNAARKIAFLVTGANKARVLGEVIHKTGNHDSYPAAHVAAADMTFYVDEAAGSGV